MHPRLPAPILLLIVALAGASLGAVSPADPPAVPPGPTPPHGRLLVAHTPDSPRNGEGSFLAPVDGRLVYVYGAFTGLGDTSRSRLRLVRSGDGGETWSAPALLFEDPQVSLLHPSLVRTADGAVGLAYSRLWSAEKAVKVFRRSADEGRTWADEVPISDGSFAYMTGAHDRLLRVGDRRILNTVHAKMGRVDGSMRVGTLVFTSDDDGRSWHNRTPSPLTVAERAGRMGEHGFWEASVVPLGGRNLLLVGRTAAGWLYELRSADGGDTWSPPARTPLANPSAPARLERIPGTDALVVLRNLDVDPASGWHGGPRVRLASQVSRDDGRSWSAPRVLECTGDGAWYDYPAAFWTGDVLHVAYRASGREAGRGVVDVRYLRLAKAWLLEGEGDGPGR